MSRWGSRQVVVLHEGREYGLTFYPQTGLDGDTASDVTARAAFDIFLDTFTFLAGRLGKQVSEVTVRSVEAQTWTNECPETERQPFGCLPRPSAGYRVVTGQPGSAGLSGGLGTPKMVRGERET